jgi:hypothetical protein
MLGLPDLPFPAVPDRFTFFTGVALYLFLSIAAAATPVMDIVFSFLPFVCLFVCLF